MLHHMQQPITAAPGQALEDPSTAAALPGPTPSASHQDQRMDQGATWALRPSQRQHSSSSCGSSSGRSSICQHTGTCITRSSRLAPLHL
jgi:hypothetical protein